ncbi:MAG: hypothetical protein WBB07_29050 [Mycobacterium sp.]
MQVAVRSRFNMGIALVGTGVIALAPIAQPMPSIAEIQVRAMSSAEVALTAAVNPIDQWVQIIQETFTNSGALVQTYLDNPAPILHQMILNGIGYGEQTVTALQTSLSNLAEAVRFDNPNGVIAYLQQGVSQILAGQIYEAYNTFFSVGFGLIASGVLPLVNLLQIPVTVVQNFANVVATLPPILVGLGFGTLATVNGTLQATTFQAQAVLDALNAGDVPGAVGALVATPGVIVNAALNGFAHTGAPGLLSPGGGIVGSLIQALNTIATAIAPPAATDFAAQVADTGPSALPSAASSVATITVGAEKAGTPETTKTAASETTPAEPTATEPAATEPAATEPAATEPAATEPAATEPAATEPAASEPAPTASETPSTATELKRESKSKTKPESSSTSPRTARPNGRTDATNGNKAEAGKTGRQTKPSGSTGSETGSDSAGTGTKSGASRSDTSGAAA